MDDKLLANQSIDNTLNPEESIIIPIDPLTLELDEKELVRIADANIEESRRFFKLKYNLYDRRKKNEIYLFGRQISEQSKRHPYKQYEAKYLDNALYEIEASLKPLAMSRLPDMIVTPGNDTEESGKTAEDVTEILDTDIKKRENRIVLGLAFKHNPVYYVGVIKARWNPEINDFVFEVVHPDYIDVDQTCGTKNADDMKWISQTIPISVQECLMRFPSKKKDLIEQLRNDGLPVEEDGSMPTKTLLSEIKIREVWFDWYKQKDDEWEKICGVMWKYKDVILKKMKNPNYDYKGETKYFTHEIPDDKSTKKEISEEEMMMAMMTGQIPENMTQEQVYRNYFDRPHKPYFFVGYDQWGKIPYDETSRIEQNIRNQENLDKRGKSIVDKLTSRIKHVFSKESGLKADDILKMDLDDPRQDLLVEGEVNKVHTVIAPERPDPAEFKDLDDTRNRMYSIAGATAIRGQLQSDVATTNQIAREADFTRADDLVEDTINAACEWMAEWSLHFIKLRYTEDHFRKILGGKDGKITFYKINKDLIEDGMEVKIKASGTDKLKTQKTAMDMAGMQMIDPLTLYRDMGLTDPEGRTEKLLMFSADPASYLAMVKGLGQTTPELVNTLMGDGMTTQLQAPESQVPTPVDTTQMPQQPPLIPQGSPRLL